MRQRIVKVAAAVAVIVLIVGGYCFFVNRSGHSGEESMQLTEVQKVIARNLETEYPATPREVVKLYNRVISCFYNESCSDEELYALGDQARGLLDEELLANNPREEYFTALKAEIEDYHKNKRRITKSTVCDSNEVEYRTVEGDECAYVSVSYFIDEDKEFMNTYEMFVLRKDAEGNWKILGFDQVGGDTGDA